MNIEKVHIQGLNFRTPDAEADPGTCRTLFDLYPSGDAQAPAWKPTAVPMPVYEHEGLIIRSAYVWNRTNTPTCLVYLAIDGRGNGCVYTILLNDDGSPKAVSPIEVFRLVQASWLTEARFAQMGDTLVACITDAGKSIELIVFSAINGVTVAHPYNIELPEVAIKAEYSPSAKSKADSWVCMRAYYCLIDGTLTAASGVSVVFIPKEKMLSLKVPKVTVHENKFNFDKLVSGMSIFISDPKADKIDAIENSVFRIAGTVTNIFSDTITPLEVDPHHDDFFLNEILDEDALNVHRVTCTNIFSFNKMLLLSGAQYNFVKPYRIDGKIDTDTFVATIPKVTGFHYNENAPYGLPALFTFTWNPVANASAYYIQVRYERDWIRHNPNDPDQTAFEWVRDLSNDDGSYIDFHNDKVETNKTTGKAELKKEFPCRYPGTGESGWYQFRIKALVNGVPGEYVEGPKYSYPR